MAPNPRDVTVTPEDGAPPGAATKLPGDRFAFNADDRAAEREDAPITVGGVIFHRRRKTWEVTRGLRGLLRGQEKRGRAAERIRKKLEALDADTPDSEIDELENQLDVEIDAADDIAYGIIAHLLIADDGADSGAIDEHRHPTLDHLRGALDVVDAGDLAALLAGGGEPDPTPASQSS